MSARKIKLVALDLDGTTLNSHHQVSDKTCQVLQRLSHAGVVIVLATGRSTLDIAKHFSLFDLPQKIYPGVSYNGACGFVHEEGESGLIRKDVFQRPLSKEQAENLVAFANEQDLVLQYYNSDIGEIFAVPKNDSHMELLGRYASLVSRAQLIVDDYNTAIEKSLAAKILLMTNDPHALVAAARARFPADEFNIIIGSPEPFFVEFLRPEASKGTGLALLCEHLGVDMEEVVAFGDGDNDQEMLQLAGIGVAMQNAKAAAKEAANVILEWTNDEDGVALHLERMERDGYFA